MNRVIADGFTLIEMVLVMVVVSIGMLGLTSSYNNAVSSLATNEILQQAAQYAQECAERAIATRRQPPDGTANGFDWFATNTFSCGNNPSGFTRTANPVGAKYTGVALGACNGHTPCPCPAGIDCRDVNITVTSTVNPALSSSVSVMLTYY